MKSAPQRYLALAEAVARLHEEVSDLPSSASIVSERRTLFIEEIRASTRQAGARLSPADVRALVARGVTLGQYPLSDYVLVAGYASGARWVAEQPVFMANTRRRPYLRHDEIIGLHVRSQSGAIGGRPGAWRRETMPAFAGGMVPPPPWLVPRDIDAFVERFAGGPTLDVSPPLWVAEAHARFERIQPFSGANGLVGRLIANLLLRRLGYPPFAIAAGANWRYLEALRKADGGDGWPLANLFARSLMASLARLVAAATPDVPLVPIAAAGDPDRASLYKAAQRGRLRTVRRGGRRYTSAAWLEAYRASRSRAGRPRTTGVHAER